MKKYFFIRGKMDTKSNFLAVGALVLIALACASGGMLYGATPKTLIVGIGSGNYATIQAAVDASGNGDTILISSGTYADQSVTVTKDITIAWTGGKAVFTYKNGIPNKKAYLVTRGNVVLRNLVFQNAKVPDNNGAGVRYEGWNLVVDSSVFQDNQEGILGGAYASGSITVTGSTFLRNGAGDGYSHGIYVGAIPLLTIANSVFQGTKVGHHVKSRATNTVVTNCLIDDGTTGTASYGIDLPNGGNATISGNTIKKGALSGNPTFISYGEEGWSTGTGVFLVQNNTFSNALSKATIGIKNLSTGTVAVTGNSFDNVSIPVQGIYSAKWNRGLADTARSSIAITVSADSYQGDPRFTLVADGKTLSGGVTVTANYASGAWQTFVFPITALPSAIEIGADNVFVSGKGSRAIHIQKIVLTTGTGTITVPLKSAQYKPSAVSLDPDGTIGNAGGYQLYFPIPK